MPGYLLHPGLATRVGTEVRYARVDRWAEPLPALFASALGQDLAALVGARIVPYPWYRAAPLDLVVRVDVTSFEADAAENARLDACWSIRGSRGITVCRDDCSSIVEPVDERGAQAQVAALSRALGELARRVGARSPPADGRPNGQEARRLFPAACSRRSASRRADPARVSRDIPAASIPPIAGRRA